VGAVLLVAASAVAGRLLLPDPNTWGVTPLAVATSAPCDTTDQTVVGRYYSDDRRNFLEFRPDGTVFMSVGGGSASYAVDGQTVVISTAIMGSARASIPASGSSGIGSKCAYTGPMFGRIFFQQGGWTIQQALAGGWSKVTSQR